MNKRVLDILLLGYKEGQYTHKEVVDKILELSDNSDYVATPKLPSLKKVNKYMNGWADKGTYKVIKKLGDFT